LIKLWISSERGGVNKNPLGDDNIIAKESTKAEQYSEKIKGERSLKNPLRGQLPIHGCHRHFELPKRIGRFSGHGGSTGNRQMSVLTAQRPGN